MCGIVGFIGGKKAAPILLDGLERLEYRGYDSAGVAVISDGEIKMQKTVERISALKQSTKNGESISGEVGIGHTRWATHGAPCEKNAHPHIGFMGRFAIVHNGIIENYATLKAELMEKGIAFKSETDTEVVVQLLESCYRGDVLSAIADAVARLRGSYSLGIICKEHPDRLYAVRHFSPLIIGLGEDGNHLASDVTALIAHTKRVLYLEDGEMAVIKKDGVKLFASDGVPVSREPSEVCWTIDAAEKGGFDHFMMKEIKEQPEVILKTLEVGIKGGDAVLEDLSLSGEELKRLGKIVITACGSAYHTGLVAKYVMEELLRLPVEVELASEFRYRNPIVDERTLVIVISQSGETADSLAALREAKARGAHTLSIVNVVGSSIAKESEDVLYTRAGPEIAVATTKAYSAQLIALYLLGLHLSRQLGRLSAEAAGELIKELLSLPEKIKTVFEREAELKALAKRCVNIDGAFFIGRNIDYAVAMEGSLKLKEISYLNCEAYAAGELKHGTISLIEEGTAVIALGCYAPLKEKLVSNIKEVKARGAYVIAIAEEGNDAMADVADVVIALPKAHPLFLASVEVVALQIFAYYVAFFKGCDIDKPRNLAKSVTVE